MQFTDSHTRLMISPAHQNFVNFTQTFENLNADLKTTAINYKERHRTE